MGVYLGLCTELPCSRLIVTEQPRHFVSRAEVRSGEGDEGKMQIATSVGYAGDQRGSSTLNPTGDPHWFRYDT